MRLIDADALLERACNLESQALAYVGKIVNDESKIEEWKIWSAILAERTAFKHDIFDAPEVKPEPQWIPVTERLPEENETVLISDELGIRFGRITDKNYKIWEWLFEHGYDFWDTVSWDVYAWMPMPEPYKGET